MGLIAGYASNPYSGLSADDGMSRGLGIEPILTGQPKGEEKVAGSFLDWLTKPAGEDTINSIRKGASGAANQRGERYLKNRYGLDSKTNTLGKPRW